LTFPDGDVTSRVVHSKAAVADLGVFLKWAEETGHTQWVRIKKEADLSAIKDHVEFSGDVVTESETGEVIDGLIHVEGDVSVSIKISE
jgi:phage host-nuclease inhibitor protein Gam